MFQKLQIISEAFLLIQCFDATILQFCYLNNITIKSITYEKTFTYGFFLFFFY